MKKPRTCSICREPGHNRFRHDPERQFVTVTCQYGPCGKEFVADPKRARKFCSWRCSNKHSAGNPKFREHLSRIAKKRWIEGRDEGLAQLAEARRMFGTRTQRALFGAWLLMWRCLGLQTWRDSALSGLYNPEDLIAGWELPPETPTSEGVLGMDGPYGDIDPDTHQAYGEY